MAHDSTDGGLCFVVTVLRTGLAGVEGRTAAIGRNRYETTITDQQEQERDEDRHEDRQAGNLRQDKRRFIFVDGTGPDDPQAGRSQPMVASITIPPAMEIKRSGLRRFPIAETGRTDKPSSEANADEQAGKQRNQPGGPAGSIGRMHGAKKLVHGIVLQKKGE